MTGETMTAGRKRVLIVSHGHPHLAPGGGEIVALDLYRALQASGDVEAHYLGAMLPQFGLPHCGSALQAASADDPNQSLYWTDRYNFFLMAQDDLSLLQEEFGRYLEAVDPDVVHFHHIHNLGVELLRVVRNTCPEARIVMTLHEFLPICHHNGQMVKTKTLAPCHRATPADCHRCFPDIQSGEFFLRERFLKAHLDLVDLFLCPSEFLLERYRVWGIPAAKLRYAENGHAGADRPPEPLPPPGRNSFAYFGQISPYKGLPVLLDAVRHLLNRKFEDFRVDVYGSMLFLDAAQKAELDERFAAVDSHVHLHGAYRPQDVVTLMSGVDWLVMPSIWWENAPLVIQEAFLARRPILCSNIGGMAEKVRDGVDGLHFRVGDPVALAETMLRAATAPDLHRRLVENIRPVHAMRASAAEHLALYGLTESEAPVEPIRRHVARRRRTGLRTGT